MWLNLMSTNNMGNPLPFHTCFLSSSAGYSLNFGNHSQARSLSPNCGCYTESTHSPCLSKTEAHIPDISCHIRPSSEEGEGPSPGRGEGFSPLRAGRRRLPLAFWSHLLGGSVIMAGASHKHPQQRTGFPERGPEWLLLWHQLGAVLATVIRHQQAKSHMDIWPTKPCRSYL